MTRLIYHRINESSDKDSPFEATILAMAYSKTLKIACPYLSYERLNRILQDHTDWRLLTDVDALFRSLANADRLSFIRLFREKKTRVRHNKDLHAKVVIGDQQALVGSANLTEMGLAKRAEMSVLMSDQGIVNELDAWFDGIWKRCKEFNDDDFKAMEQFANETLPESSSKGIEKGKLPLDRGPRFSAKLSAQEPTTSPADKVADKTAPAVKIKKKAAAGMSVVKTAPENTVPKAGKANGASVKRRPRGVRKVQSGNRTFTMPVKEAAVLLLAQKSNTELGKVALLNALHDQFGFTFGRRPYHASSPGGINTVCDNLAAQKFVTRRTLKGSNLKVIKVTSAGAAVVVLDPI